MRGFLKQKNNIWVILAYFGGVCPPLGPPEGVGGSISPNTQSLWVAWSYQQIKSIGKIISLVKMVEDTCRGLLRMLIDLRVCVCVELWILKRKKELRDLKIAKRFFD